MTNNKQQTAVEWLVEKLASLTFDYMAGFISKREYDQLSKGVIRQAKEMEKEIIIKAWKPTEVTNDMERILVPEELVLALKEIGCDESCPTYQEAFKWFTEKKITFGITDHLYTSVYHKIIVADKETEDIYDDYDDAKNACIKQLIEIVKGGNK